MSYERISVILLILISAQLLMVFSFIRDIKKLLIRVLSNNEYYDKEELSLIHELIDENSK